MTAPERLSASRLVSCRPGPLNPYAALILEADDPVRALTNEWDDPLMSAGNPADI
jgi:hypothetical protein